MDHSDFVILLTACVNPNGMVLTQLKDSSTRLEQYLSSIHFFLKKVNCKIVVVENSNFDFSPYFTKEIEEKKIECLHFDGNTYDKFIGKGYGEACIIEYALSNSYFIKNTTAIIKITGRFKIDNIRTVVKLCNNKSNTIYTMYSRKVPYVFKSVLVIAPVGFWKLFVSQKEQINDSKKIYFEHLLYRLSIISSKSGTYRISMFKCPVKYNGFSGTSGDKYKNDSFFEWLFKYLYFSIIFKYRYCN